MNAHYATSFWTRRRASCLIRRAESTRTISPGGVFAVLKRFEILFRIDWGASYEERPYQHRVGQEASDCETNNRQSWLSGTPFSLIDDHVGLQAEGWDNESAEFDLWDSLRPNPGEPPAEISYCESIWNERKECGYKISVWVSICCFMLRYVVFAAAPYNNIAFKIPNKEIEKLQGRSYTDWDKEKKIFKVWLISMMSMV